MNVFKRFLCFCAEKTADLLKFDLQKILSKKARANDKLNKGWSKKNFSKMEEARMLAKEKGHFLEEALILFEEMKYFLKFQPPEKYALHTLENLKKITPVFDLPDSEFKDLFEKIYLVSPFPKVIEQTYQCVYLFFNEFDKMADFMLAHLQPELSVLCGKVKLKINYLCQDYGKCPQVTLEDVAETMFFLSNVYGRIRDLDDAMRYYNMAIDYTKAKKDDQYLYIACMRKLTICIACKHMAISYNVDEEANSVLDILLALAEK